MTAVDMASEARAVRVVPREFDEFYRGVYQEMARALALAVGDVGDVPSAVSVDGAIAALYQRVESEHDLGTTVELAAVELWIGR